MAANKVLCHELSRKRFHKIPRLISLLSPSILSCEINYQNTRFSVVHHCVERCFHDILLQLCERGVQLNNVQGKKGTPLHVACFLGTCLKCVHILLSYGANPNLKYNERTPIHLLIQNMSVHKTQLCSYLFSYHGTNVKVLDGNGNTYMDLLLGSGFHNLEYALILFRRMAPVTNGGVATCELSLDLCCWRIDAIIEKTDLQNVLSLAMLVRAYSPRDTALRKAIHTLSSNIDSSYDQTKRELVEGIIHRCRQMLGVKRLDFLCKSKVLKHYDVLDLPFIADDDFALPAFLTGYLCDDSYSSKRICNE